MSIYDHSLQDDDWSTGMLYFRETLQVLILDVEGQCERVGGGNVPWELRQDAIDFGDALVESSDGKLGDEVLDEIRALVDALKELPESAYQGDAVTALNHPQWSVVRRIAAKLVERL
ncbi:MULTISPECIES: hypothetical protein [unclassified Paraburkholderia]|uniref:hypothetical protein n=1 Tax=unclassified Paraburkholderia TaxID=2615204 RepID=UPI002AB05688|nr:MULTISPECIES: hypothetical protein [unclassified Paraburkholderia]